MPGMFAADSDASTSRASAPSEYENAMRHEIGDERQDDYMADQQQTPTATSTASEIVCSIARGQRVAIR